MSKVDLEVPTSIIDQAPLGCTQRESWTNKTIVAEKQDLLTKLVSSSTSTITKFNTDFKNDVVSPSYDTQGHAQKYVERYCELKSRKQAHCTNVLLSVWMTINSKKKNWRQLDTFMKFARKLHWNASVQLALADLWMCVRALLLSWPVSVCQVVATHRQNTRPATGGSSHLISSHLISSHRNGRPHLWTLNHLPRSVTKWNRACGKGSARPISQLHSPYGELQKYSLGTAKVCFFRMQISLETWRTPSHTFVPI